MEPSIGRARDHIREHHPDAVKPDTYPNVDVAEHPVSTPSQAAAQQAVPTVAPAAQPSVAPATPKQAAARSPTAAARTQRKTPACADVQQTGRTDVAPRRSVHTSKAPQRLIEEM